MFSITIKYQDIICGLRYEYDTIMYRLYRSAHPPADTFGPPLLQETLPPELQVFGYCTACLIIALNLSVSILLT